MGTEFRLYPAVGGERADLDMMRLLLGKGVDANAEGGIYGNVMRAALYR